MDATQRKLVSGLKGLISEIECGKLDRMTEQEYKLFLEGLSLIIEAKKTDYGHCNTNNRSRWNLRSWINNHVFPSKTKADASGNGGKESE